MGATERNKIFDSFEFNPTTEFTLGQKSTPEVKESNHFTPVTVETRDRKSAEDLLEMSSEEPVSDNAVNKEEATEVAFPTKYSGLEGFYNAIGDSVATKEAKYALLAQMGY